MGGEAEGGIIMFPVFLAYVTVGHGVTSGHGTVRRKVLKEDDESVIFVVLYFASLFPAEFIYSYFSTQVY